MDDYGQQLAEQLVIEVKAAMVRAGIQSSRALGRAIGQNSQYMSNRLDGGNPRTGERVPLNVRDIAEIGEAVGVEPHVLVERAERALAGTTDDKDARVLGEGRFRGLGVTAAVPDHVAAQIGKRSISEEQEAWE